MPIFREIEEGLAEACNVSYEMTDMRNFAIFLQFLRQSHMQSFKKLKKKSKDFDDLNRLCCGFYLIFTFCRSPQTINTMVRFINGFSKYHTTFPQNGYGTVQTVLH
jgi:hypothetical protein